jgi:dTMP kinase
LAHTTLTEAPGGIRRPRARRLQRRAHTGALIVVEGIDGSGKSTQLYLLKRWLELRGYKVFFSEWNSSELVKRATRRGKRKNILTPNTFSLIHATDFADRFERQIFPLMRAGYIVLCDRYVYTAFARDTVRGCSMQWLRNLYRFAPAPDITFYFRVPLEVALQRILAGRSELKYHEAGMDLGLSDDPQESFELFQGRILDAYESLVVSDRFVCVDATRPVSAQQAEVRRIVRQRLNLDAFRQKTS